MIEKNRDVTFNLQDHLLGGVSSQTNETGETPKLTKFQASIDANGSPLTDEALEAAKNADAVLLGAIGGPVRPTHPPKAHKRTPYLRTAMNRNGAPALSARSRVFCVCARRWARSATCDPATSRRPR